MKYEMGLAAANIILTGGNVKFPNFEERFLSELRPLVPDIYPVQVSRKL
jgi:actin-related protein